MRFTSATVVTRAAAAAATSIPSTGYGSWNVSISHTGGSDRRHIETVTGVYANAQLNDNIPVNCTFQGMLNGEVVDKTTCHPESFSYMFKGIGYDDGYLYQLTLTQTVTLDGTNTTVNGISDKIKMISDKVTGESFFDPNMLVRAFTTVTYMPFGTIYRGHS